MTVPHAERIEPIVDFWFGEVSDDGTVGPGVAERWFMPDPQFDRVITERFGPDVERAARGDLDRWPETARGALAFVLVCDQFPRNMFRDQRQAYSLDPKAVAATRATVERGLDRELRPLERAFLYMPLMHSESHEAQEQSLECFRTLAEEAPPPVRKQCEGFYEYAKRHRDVIQRFGRFPHRNVIFDRTTSIEEAQFLEKGPGW